MMLLLQITTLHACARDKVSGRCHCRYHPQKKKITRSWDLGTSVTRKYNESAEVGKKLASGCLELSGMAYKLHK